MQHFNTVVYNAASWAPLAFTFLMACPFTWGKATLRKR